MTGTLAVVVNVGKTPQDVCRCRDIVDLHGEVIKEIFLLADKASSVKLSPNVNDTFNLCLKWQKEDRRVKIIHQKDKVTLEDLLKKISSDYCCFLSPADKLPENFLLKLLIKAEQNKVDMVFNREIRFCAAESEKLDFPLWKQTLFESQRTVFNANTDAAHIFNYAPNLNSQAVYRTDFLRTQNWKDINLFSSFIDRNLVLHALLKAKRITYAEIGGSFCLLPKNMPEILKAELPNFEKFIKTSFELFEGYPQSELLKQSFSNFMLAWLQNISMIAPEPLRGQFLYLMLQMADEYKISYQPKDYFYDFSVYAGLFAIHISKFSFPQSTDKVVPVVIRCNKDDEIAATGVIVTALKKYVQKGEFYDVYVVYNNNNNKNILRLLNYMSDHNISVRTISLGSYLPLKLQGISLDYHDYMSIEAPAVLNGYDKVIFLSSNVLPLCNIAVLMKTEMNDCIIAAVCNNSDRNYVEKKKSLVLETYINPDVMLINTNSWHNENITLKCESKINKKNKDISTEQQDVINDVCLGKIHILKQNWNVLIPQVSDICDIEDYPSLPENTKMINYESQKPWQNKVFLFADIWWKCARTSPIYEYILYADNLKKNKISSTEPVITAQIIQQIMQKQDTFFPQIKMYIKEKILSFLTFGTASIKHKQNAKALLSDMIRKAS